MDRAPTDADPRGHDGGILSPGTQDPSLDLALRPRSFGDFTGQRHVLDNLRIYVAAARKRKEPLDHVLLSGLPGLGKTTLAEIVAREMGTGLRSTSGPMIERPGDLAGILTALRRNDILFIDEIHRIGIQVEEYLYSAMEDFRIDIVLDQGPRARTMQLRVEPFTLIGATTREGLLSAPFRSRFGVFERLEPYPVEDLQVIVVRSARLLEIGLADDASRLIAERARGTPRLVNRFIRRIRDLAEVEGSATITTDIATRGLERLGVDGLGMCRVDRQILETIARFGGQPVGLKTLAVSVGEEERTIEDVYEPFLIRRGFLCKTPRGRTLTHEAMTLLGVRLPSEREGSLFSDLP